MWLLWLRSKIQRLILVTLNVTLVTLVTLRCANWPKMLSSAHTPVYGAHGFHRFYRIFPKMLEFSQSPERPRLCEILVLRCLGFVRWWRSERFGAIFGAFFECLCQFGSDPALSWWRVTNRDSVKNFFVFR